MTIQTQEKKYREVERTLRQEIQSGKWLPGERLPSERDMARRFEVAHMTIRQAVGALIQEDLLRRVHGKGTFVVEHDWSQPASSTRFPMVLLFPSILRQIDRGYFPEVLAGFQQTLEAHGECAGLCESYSDRSHGSLEPGSAVACLLVDRSDLEIIESLRDSGHHVLAINHYTGRRSIPSVRIDDAQGIEQAVDHLVALGHERIGFITGPPQNLDAADRLRGFRSAITRHGLGAAPEAAGMFTEISGYAAAQHLLSSPRPPTAIVCASDLPAIGVMKAAREYGLAIPRDLSLVGFGDFSVAPYVDPGLTTVRQTRAELGRRVAESLIVLANGGTVADTILDARLLLRETTAPPGDRITKS